MFIQYCQGGFEVLRKRFGVAQRWWSDPGSIGFAIAHISLESAGRLGIVIMSQTADLYRFWGVRGVQNFVEERVGAIKLIGLQCVDHIVIGAER